MEKPSVKRILIVRLSALGDVVHTLPVLAMIRRQYPDAVIGWLVEEGASPLLEGNVELDFVHISRRKQWMKTLFRPWLWSKTLREMRELFRSIQQVGYEVGIDAQGLFKSSVTLFLTGISKRIGFVEAREGAPFLYTQHVSLPHSYFDPNIPITEHYRHLVSALGVKSTEDVGYPLPAITERHLQEVNSLLYGFGQAEQPLVVLAPATQWQSKHWPVLYWREFIRKILEQSPWNIAMIGGVSDETLVQRILEELGDGLLSHRLVNLCGKTDLTQLHSLFHRADAVVGSDSAPLHLAGAVGHPVVIGLYGPTSPVRTPPPSDHRTLLLSVEPALSCQPCHKATCALGTQECLYALTPERVFRALQERLVTRRDESR